MTRNTVEGRPLSPLMTEKIYQTSKKKMVLDHLIVENIDNSEEKLDVESMLLHGLKSLFEDDGGKDIKYDDNDIERLLDRNQIEETVKQKPEEEGGLGSFKTARIWANSTAQLEDLPDDNNDMLEVGYWDQIIQERMSLAEAQRLAQEEENGRGKRRASRKVFRRDDVDGRWITPRLQVRRIKRNGICGVLRPVLKAMLKTQTFTWMRARTRMIKLRRLIRLKLVPMSSLSRIEKNGNLNLIMLIDMSRR